MDDDGIVRSRCISVPRTVERYRPDFGPTGRIFPKTSKTEMVKKFRRCALVSMLRARGLARVGGVLSWEWKSAFVQKVKSHSLPGWLLTAGQSRAAPISSHSVCEWVLGAGLSEPRANHQAKRNHQVSSRIRPAPSPHHRLIKQVGQLIFVNIREILKI